MRRSITFAFRFHAAHTLPWHPGNCSRLHGHTYTCEIRVAGELDRNGIIMDFDAIGPIVESRVLSVLDHAFLNDHFASPTAENVCEWIFNRLAADIPRLDEVRLWETQDTSAVVTR